MTMNIVEKILSQHTEDQALIRPGDLVVVGVDCVVLIDMNFYDGIWVEPRDVFDPEKVAIVYDHVIPVHDKAGAAYLDRGRAFAQRVGIDKFHDVGGDQGISHAIVAEVPYAMAGGILICADSHTCSAGALNCAARGLGAPEVTYILSKGFTWFMVTPTVRYKLMRSPPAGTTGKDILLHIAARWGSHENSNVEFGGPGLASMSIGRRRELTTMCAEISVDFAVCEYDDLLEAYFRQRGVRDVSPVMPDAGASYADVRELDLSAIEPMVGMPHAVVDNSVPVSQCAGTPINQAFIGSCAGGTLEDLREAARVLEGRKVARGVTLLITPSSQAIYRQALSEGLIEIVCDAGALVTASSCGMCAGFENALGANDVCISSSTRNFRGRMGHADAEIYLASSCTVAASAVAGEIVPETYLESASAR